MIAEIIGVGTELLLGHVINTDASLVAKELASLGINIHYMQVVGDNATRFEAALAMAVERSDIVITTGGLGPTPDDLTREITAKFCGKTLVRDEKSWLRLREYFGERPMSANQEKQVFMPSGAIILDNENGTAPGCILPLENGKIIILLPGPPTELLPMLENGVRPFLQKLINAHIHSVNVRTFGIGEGAAAELLGDLLNGSNPTAATYASNGEMFVKITARGKDQLTARQLAAPLTKQICQKLGNVVYSLDESSLEAEVVKKLIGMNRTIATAESCTGGLLAKRITDQPGSSAIFRLGVISYANKIKEDILHVPADLLNSWGAVSAQVALSMAKNVRLLDNSFYGVGISGIAGPDGGTTEKPVGLVYIALVFAGGKWIRRMWPQGRNHGRQWIRQRAASHALDLVRRHLMNMPPDILK